MNMILEQVQQKLQRYGQEHLLKYYEELSDEEKKALLDQIEATDMDIISACKEKEKLVLRGVITPLKCMQLPEIEAERKRFTETGLTAIRDGKAAALLLAGGMGTRLGTSEPKGMYNIGISRELHIFECIINNLMDVVRRSGTWIHLFVMTSDRNHKATVSFLKQKGYFGYNKEFVHFFMQEMAAATDYEGKIYLEEKGKLSTSPNGNGGWFISLKRSGLLDLIHKEGVEWINVFAVDNVLQRITDPCFLGATIHKNCDVGAKVVRKNAPDEKVGVMCLEDGRPSIVEYYDLTDEMMNAADEDGEPLYNFGVILNYMFRISALEELLTGSLPLHIVEKKISYLNDSGIQVKPEEPNGYKYENLVLDMIHQLDSCLPYEVVRNKEFAPVKNAAGIDSVESARILLQENGVEL